MRYDTVLDMLAGAPFTRHQMIDALSSKGFASSYNSIGKLITTLMSEGRIGRTGRNEYIVLDAVNRVLYKPVATEQLTEVIRAVQNRFPLIEFIVWDAYLLNEFLNHQIANDTIFLEVEGMVAESVYEHLRYKLHSTVLLKPDTRTFRTYWEPDVVVIQKLVTQSPGNRKNTHLTTIEKLVVDLFANKIAALVFSAAELPDMIDAIRQRYVLDETKLFRYAKRRHCEGRIMEYFGG
jgi:hypothetical protein